MPNIQEYAAKFTADTREFDTGAQHVEQRTQSLSQSLGTGLAIGAGAAVGVAAFGALAGGIGAAASSAIEFEKTMSGVKAVSGASQETMSQLSGLALQLGKDTSFSASEAATGLEELVKAGVSVGDIMGGAARASLDLAAAGGVNVKDAAEIAANALNVFSMKGSDMAHVADLIAGAANASAIDVNDFKFSLAASGAVAATVGFDFDDLAQAIAVMGQAGIKGSDAGTSLKTMMLNLQPVTDKQKSLFKDLGITLEDGSNAFFDATGKVKSMAEVAQVLQDALGGMTEEQRLATLEVIFGSDAIRAGAVLTKAGAAGFNEMAAAMGNVSAQSVAETRLDNLWGSLEKLKGTLETGAIILGSKFTPLLKDLADSANDAATKGIAVLEDSWRTLEEVFNDDWEPSEKIDPLVNAVGIAGLTIKNDLIPPIKELGQFLTEHKELVIGFAAAIGTLGAAAGVAITITGLATAIAFLVSPIGILTVAIGTLTAAWLGNWGDIQGKTDEATEAVNTAVMTTHDAFTRFSENASTNWETIKTDTATAWTNIQSAFDTGTASIGDSWNTGWENVKGVQAAAWDTLTPENKAKFDELKKDTDELWSLINQAWDIGWKDAQRTNTTAWAAIQEKWSQEQNDIHAKTDPFWSELSAKWEAGGAELQRRLQVTWDQCVEITVTFFSNLFNEFVKADGELTTKAMELGANIVKGIGDSIQRDIGKITDILIGGVNLALTAARGLLPGQGTAGGSKLTGGSGKAARYTDAINAASAATGVPADVIAGLIDTESSGETSVSPAGARGLMQVVPGQGYDLPGEDWRDPSTSIMQGARAVRDKYNATGDWDRAAGAYFGYGVDAGGMDTNTYMQRFKANRAGYSTASAGFMNLGNITTSQMEIGLDPVSAANACGPYAAMLFANAVGRYPTAKEATDLASQFGWSPYSGMTDASRFDDLTSAMISGSGYRAQSYAPSLEAASGIAASGSPVGFNTPGHYFVASGQDPTTGKFNVGDTGTVAGGSAMMSYDEIKRLGGGLYEVIGLVGQAGSGFQQLGGIVDTQAGLMAGAMAAAGASITQGMDLQTDTVVKVGSAMQDLGAKSEALSTFLTSKLALGTTQATQAMDVFADRMAPMAAQVQAGGVSFDDLATSIVTAASSSGLAAQPFADLSSGLITQEQAITDVINAAAAANPAYAGLAEQVATGAISVQDAASQFVTLSQQTNNLTAAVVPATDALKTMGDYAPTLIAEFGTGATSAQVLREKIVNLAQASGLATGELETTTGSATTFNDILKNVIDTAAAADPRFQELSQKIKDEGQITDATTLEFLDLLSTISKTSGTVAPAITAHQELGTAAAKATTESKTAWETILKEISETVKSIDATVKRMSDAIIGYLESISNVELDVNTGKMVSSLNKGTSAAKKLKDALDDLDKKTSSNAKSEFSKGTAQGGSAINPDFYASGGYVRHAASGLNPVYTGELGRELAWLPDNARITPHWKTAMIEDSLAYGRGQGGGGTPIVVQINGPVYGINDLDDKIIETIRNYRRRGGDI